MNPKTHTAISDVLRNLDYSRSLESVTAKEVVDALSDNNLTNTASFIRSFVARDPNLTFSLKLEPLLERLKTAEHTPTNNRLIHKECTAWFDEFVDVEDDPEDPDEYEEDGDMSYLEDEDDSDIGHEAPIYEPFTQTPIKVEALWDFVPLAVHGNKVAQEVIAYQAFQTGVVVTDYTEFDTDGTDDGNWRIGINWHDVVSAIIQVKRLPKDETKKGMLVPVFITGPGGPMNERQVESLMNTINEQTGTQPITPPAPPRPANDDKRDFDRPNAPPRPQPDDRRGSPEGLAAIEAARDILRNVLSSDVTTYPKKQVQDIVESLTIYLNVGEFPITEETRQTLNEVNERVARGETALGCTEQAPNIHTPAYLEGAWKAGYQAGYRGGLDDAAKKLGTCPNIADEYQKDALRTESLRSVMQSDLVAKDCYGKIENVQHPVNIQSSRLLHGAIGCCTEAGELQDMLKKHFFYGKPLDLVNIMEEAGDMLWYIAILLDAAGYTMSQAMDTNIAKLRKRFPDKYDDNKALNRDLVSERKILEGTKMHQDIINQGPGTRDPITNELHPFIKKPINTIIKKPINTSGETFLQNGVPIDPERVTTPTHLTDGLGRPVYTSGHDKRGISRI